MVQPNKRSDYVDVYRWVKACFLKTGKPPYKLDLLHIAGGDSQIVQSWSDFKNNDGPDSVGDDIINAALEDSEIYQGVQTYTIIYYEKSDRDIAARKGFRVQGGTLRQGVEGESEPPTEKGYTSQIMRHNEAIAKLNINSLTQQMNRLLSTCERKDDIIEKLVNKQFDTIIAFEQLMDRKAEREIKLQSDRSEQKLKDRLFERIDSALPPLLGKILPNNIGVMKMQTNAFFESLNEIQIDKILTLLTENQSKNLAKAQMRNDVFMLHSIISSLTEQQNIEISQILKPEQFAALRELFEKATKKEETSVSSNSTENGVQK